MIEKGQTRGAQVHETHLSDGRGGSWLHPPPRPYLSVGSGNERLLLEVPARLRSSKVKQILFLVFVFTAAVFEQVLTYCNLLMLLLLHFPPHCSITGGNYWWG